MDKVLGYCRAERPHGVKLLSVLSKETTWQQRLAFEPLIFRSVVHRVNFYTTAFCLFLWPLKVLNILNFANLLHIMRVKVGILFGWILPLKPKKWSVHPFPVYYRAELSSCCVGYLHCIAHFQSVTLPFSPTISTTQYTTPCSVLATVCWCHLVLLS